MTNKSVLLIAVSLFALSACSSAEERLLSDLSTRCMLQAPGSHKRIKTVGYVGAAWRGMPQSNSRNVSSPHLEMVIFQMVDTPENVVVLSSQPERKLDVGMKAESGIFIIPKSMFDHLDDSGNGDFLIKTTNGGTASRNDKVEIIFDSFNAGKGCVNTIEEIRKL